MCVFLRLTRCHTGSPTVPTDWHQEEPSWCPPVPSSSLALLGAQASSPGWSGCEQRVHAGGMQRAHREPQPRGRCAEWAINRNCSYMRLRKQRCGPPRPCPCHSLQMPVMKWNSAFHTLNKVGSLHSLAERGQTWEHEVLAETGLWITRLVSTAAKSGLPQAEGSSAAPGRTLQGWACWLFPVCVCEQVCHILNSAFLHNL